MNAAPSLGACPLTMPMRKVEVATSSQGADTAGVAHGRQPSCLASFLSRIRNVNQLPLQVEKRWYDSVRSDGSHPKVQALCLALVVVVAIVLPLLATGTMSFEEAKGICRKRRLGVFVEKEEEGEFDDVATHHFLYMGHVMNCLATVTSLCGYFIWLFGSPHTLRAEAEGLDRTRTFLYLYYV